MAPPCSSHGHREGRNGPLSSLPSDAHRNSFIFPSRPKPPIQEDSYKDEDQYGDSYARLDREPSSSKSTEMPVAPYPYVQLYRPSSYEAHTASAPSRPYHRKHRHSASTPFAHHLLAFTTHRAHTHSLSHNGPATFPHELDGGRKRYSSSSRLHPPPLRHQRSRSDSLLLPHQQHSQPQRGHSIKAPVTSGYQYLPDEAPRPRAHSFTEPPFPHRRRMSTNALPPHDPFPSPMVSRREPHRVRFILPARLHDYLRVPPFRISIKRPLSSEILAYYHPYLDQPATNPPVSILLIKTPLLRWPIRLGGYLSVRQVLDGICAALRTVVTLDEYEGLAANRALRRDVIEAYQRRKTQERRRGLGYGGLLEPMRRVDWLAGRTVFEGLEESGDGEGVWCLRLGWKKTL